MPSLLVQYQLKMNSCRLDSTISIDQSRARIHSEQGDTLFCSRVFALSLAVLSSTSAKEMPSSLRSEIAFSRAFLVSLVTAAASISSRTALSAAFMAVEATSSVCTTFCAASLSCASNSTTCRFFAHPRTFRFFAHPRTFTSFLFLQASREVFCVTSTVRVPRPP